MPWEEILAPAKTTAIQPAAVTLKIAPKTGTAGSRRLVIAIRPDLIDTPPLWWRQGERVKAMIGTGEHHGRVLLKPQGAFKVTRLGGRERNSASLIFLPCPSIVLPSLDKTGRVVADFDWNEGWIEVALPRSWLAPGAVVTPIPPPAPPAKPDGKFRTGATTMAPPPGHLGHRA